MYILENWWTLSGFVGAILSLYLVIKDKKIKIKNFNTKELNEEIDLIKSMQQNSEFEISDFCISNEIKSLEDKIKDNEAEVNSLKTHLRVIHAMVLAFVIGIAIDFSPLPKPIDMISSLSEDEIDAYDTQSESSGLQAPPTTTTEAPTTGGRRIDDTDEESQDFNETPLSREERIDEYIDIMRELSEFTKCLRCGREGFDVYFDRDNTITHLLYRHYDDDGIGCDEIFATLNDFVENNIIESVRVVLPHGILLEFRDFDSDLNIRDEFLLMYTT